jgi:hypothetical protein
MCYGRNGQPTPAIGSCHKVLLSLILFWAIEVALVNAKALEGCDDSCGNVSIPYPFGTREGCYMNEDFLITCNHSYTPPLAFLGNSTINVTDIWLSGELRVYAYVAYDCYNRSGERTSCVLHFRSHRPDSPSPTPETSSRPLVVTHLL